MLSEKQLTLRPADLVVAVKLAVNRHRDFVLAQLGTELQMAVSAVHGSVRRAEVARLVSRSGGSIRAIRASVTEFIIHGAKYAFPAVLGSSGRGVPTSVGAPVLLEYFDQAKLLPPVWPHPEGRVYGPMVTPLHSSVPTASLSDPVFYDAMALVDAIRVGAARERVLAIQKIEELLA